MATELTSAYITLIPTLRGAGAAIGKEFAGVGTSGGTEAGHGFKSTFSQIVGGTFVGQVLGDLFRGATRGIVDAVRSAFEATSQWGVITAQTGAVIKSTGAGAGVTAGQVHDLAMSIERTTGTTAESVQSGENLLLTFRSLKNGVGAGNDVFNQATVALVDMSRALGKDPQDAAIQLGKALNDPITGMTALRRVGVSFTEDQQKLIKSLTESGNVMGAQKVILAELTAEFGGSGAAFAQTFTGRLTLMKEAWHHITEELVSGVEPGLGKVFTAITNIFNKLLDSGALTTFSAKLSKLGEGAADKLSNLAQKISDVITATKGTGLSGFVDQLTKVAPWLSLLGILFEILKPLLPEIVKALVKLGPPLADVVKQLIPMIPPLVRLVSDLLPGLRDIIKTTAPAVTFLVDALTGKGQFKSGEKDIITFTNTLHDQFAKGLDQLNNFSAGVQKWHDKTSSQFAIGASQIGGSVSTIVSKFQTGGSQISGSVGTIVSKFQTGAGQIGGAANQIGSFVNTAAGTVGQALGHGTVAVGTFTSNLGTQFGKGAQQIGSFASTAGTHIGSFIGTVGSQFSKGAGQVQSFAGTIGDALGRGASAAGAAMGRMAAAIGSGISDAVGFVASLPGKALAALGDLGSKLFSAGASLIGGFVNGIKSAIGGVVSAASGVLGAVSNLFPHSPAKEGPFSGSGWTAVQNSGGALFAQFLSGMEGTDIGAVLTARFEEARQALPAYLTAGVGSSSVLAAPSSAPRFPDTIVVRDVDGTFIARMQTEAQGVVDTQASWNDIQSRGGTVR